MKKIIMVILGCSWAGFSFATECGVNSQGNKYCTYDNGCYEYWNKNGTYYNSCETNNTVIERNPVYRTGPDPEGDYYPEQYEEEFDEPVIVNKKVDYPLEYYIFIGGVILFIGGFIHHSWKEANRLEKLEQESAIRIEQYRQQKERDDLKEAEMSTEEPRNEFTYDDYLDELENENLPFQGKLKPIKGKPGYYHNPQGFNADKWELLNKLTEGENFQIGDQVEYTDWTSFNGEPESISVTTGTVISVKDEQILEIEFPDGTTKVVNKILAPIRKVIF